MKKLLLLIVFSAGITLNLHGQENSKLGLSITSSFFPEFRLLEASVSPGMAHGVQVSFYDSKFSWMRYSFHYARGYHKPVAYSAGLSAGYVIPLSGRFSLTPGLGVTEYKMKDRTCRISFQSVMNKLFNIYEPCPDDSHVSFNPFLSAGFKLSGPFSIALSMDYRAMLSNVRRLKETKTEPLPGGGSITYEFYETEKAFYKAGLGVGIAFRVDLFY